MAKQGCWFSYRHKGELHNPVLCLLCVELHFRVCSYGYLHDSTRSTHNKTRSFDFSTGKCWEVWVGTARRIGCSNTALCPSYGNYLWSMVCWFPFTVVIKYSKQGIRDIMEVQADRSNDSMTVRSMPVCVREKLQSRLFRSVIRSYSSAIIKSCVNWANLFWSCFISVIMCQSK